MRKLDETTALAIVFGNTKRKKRKENLVTIAKAFDYLEKLYESQKAVAEKVGLSPEMIRQFLTILKLPPEVQELFSRREIDSVDVAKELGALKNTHKQIALARKIKNLLSKDTRDVKRLIKTEGIKVNVAKNTIMRDKDKGIHIFMIDFDNETYNGIMKAAKAAKKKEAEFVRDIVCDWLLSNKIRKNKKG